MKASAPETLIDPFTENSVFRPKLSQEVCDGRLKQTVLAFFQIRSAELLACLQPV